MDNKTCIVTGANAGLGFWTSLALANLDWQVFMLCRSPEKAELAFKHIREKTGNNKLDIVLVDLSEIHSIDKAVQTINAKTDRIDVLINNAASVSSDHTLNSQGIEWQLAVNHLAPFYITHKVIPLLKKSDEEWNSDWLRRLHLFSVVVKDAEHCSAHMPKIQLKM